MNIAIIPARSGSKRIKSKNIKLFFGKPIIKYTIEKLIKSKIFNKVYVSTNSKKIAKISKESGADVPFLRNENLSGDKISTKDVISDFINKIKFSVSNINYVFCVYPCTPLLEIKDLKKGLQLSKKNHSSFVYPVLKYKHPIQRSFKLIHNTPKYIYPKFHSYNTQNLDNYFHDAGQFYISSINNWLSNKSLHLNSKCFEIDLFNGVDIDDLDDWKLTELIYKYKLKN